VELIYSARSYATRRTGRYTRRVRLRDFRDAKAMARALCDVLKTKAIETTHAEALELIAKAFGYKNWNILSAKIEAAEPKPSDEHSLSVSGRCHRNAQLEHVHSLTSGRAMAGTPVSSGSPAKRWRRPIGS
jgi:Glyoxalase superfamily protein